MGPSPFHQVRFIRKNRATREDKTQVASWPTGPPMPPKELFSPSLQHRAKAARNVPSAPMKLTHEARTGIKGKIP
jgi:hypothetical protein